MGRATKNRLTCGHFGGRNAQGEPCGVSAVDGPCAKHAQQVTEAASDVLDTTFEFRTPPFQLTKKKVCIVGFTKHREIAETLDRDEWEIWGLNELHRYMPVDMFDRWFEIHTIENLLKDVGGQDHIDDLKSFDIPVYMQHNHEDIPPSVRFPKEELCDLLDSTYWTNCPAWMIGWAIALGAEEIAVVGVDMAQDSEYHTQRTCCEHWLGFARGRGIHVWVPEVSDLLKCVGLYGYEDEGTVLSRKLEERLEWLHEQDNQHLALIRQMDSEYLSKKTSLNTQCDMMRGAIVELQSHRKTKNRDERIEAVQGKLSEGETLIRKLESEYENKRGQLRDARNQLVGGIQDVNYILRSWMVKSDNPNGGNIPSIEERSADPRLGIASPYDDSSNFVSSDNAASGSGAEVAPVYHQF